MKELANGKEKIDIGSFNEQILKECLAMAKYAMNSGKKVSPDMITTIQSFAATMDIKDLKNLIQIHAKLVKAIAPANPKAILLIEEESAKNRRLKFLGLIPLVRQMMIVASIALILFVFCQTFGNADTTKDVMDQEGFSFLLIISTLMASAGMGATFSALFKVNKYITSGTYDPKYETSYWIRFVLGLIAGLALSVLIPMGENNDLGRPLLAMLGGFSANLVYRVFTRLVEAVESLVAGGKEESLAVKEKELNVQALENEFQTRQEIATGLTDIVKQFDSQTDLQQVKDKLQAYINDFQLKSDSATPDASNRTEPDTANKTEQDENVNHQSA